MIRVEGHSNLYRDENTGAIVNCDDVGYDQYVNSVKHREKKDRELSNLRKDIDENKINFLTPKASLRYSPVHRRDIDDDVLRLDYSNLFTLNKNSHIDVVEKGASLAVGLELSNLDFKKNKTEDEN